MVVDSFADDTQLASSIDTLLGHLLCGTPGYPRRPTDGVVLEHLHTDGRRASASGVVVMIGQTVEPIRAVFTLDESWKTLIAARIDFGDSTTRIFYGSREHRKLRDAILLDPAANRPWKGSFRRDIEGWHHGAV